ncbi:MAG: FMN-binding protein [Actinomycetes bacterium]
MKRALLIAGGTISGLGAVLAITPPQLGSSQAVGMSSGMGSTSGGSASSTSSTAATTASAAPSASSTSATPARTVKKVVKKVVAKATSQATTSTQNSTTQATPSATPTQTQSSTPTPAPAKVVVPAPAKNTANGTFTGPSVFVSYGNVQVEITVRDGKIVDAQALQSPNGRSQRFSDYALPQLRQETLAAQSSSISNISGASYTSYGWYKSLQGALAKAGL